jgi:endoglucanase Acf2
MIFTPTRLFFCALTGILSFAMTGEAQNIQVGAGSYRTDLPSGDRFRRVEASPQVSAGYSGPIPTSDWCSSLVWPMHSLYSLPMFPHPLGVQAHEDGLGMGYTSQAVVSSSLRDGKVFQRGTDYRFPYRESLRVGLQGWQSPETLMDRCSDWSVTALWEMPDEQWRATLAHGSPFVYFEKDSNRDVRVVLKSAPVNRNEIPVEPLVFRWANITAKHPGKNGAIQLAVNAGQNIGVGTKARLVYDFDGDGTTDRVETFGLFALDPVATSYESYSSERQMLDDNLTYGEIADFQRGSVTLEFWKCFGEGDVEIKLDDSYVTLPWDDAPRRYLGREGTLGPEADSGQVTLDDASGGGAATVFFHAENVLGLTVNGSHFGLFAPQGSTWKGIEEGRANIVSSDLAKKDYWSIAVLPDDQLATLRAFEKVAFAFIKETRVSFQYDAETASVRTEFKVETEAKEGGNLETLMALYQHQHLYLNEAGLLVDGGYASPRGEMKMVRGTRFSTTLPFTGVLPTLPCSEEQRTTLKSLLEKDFRTIMARKEPFEREDSYWNGKEFGKFSELIQIADQLDEDEIRDALLGLLKSRLEDWLIADGELFLYYDDRWKTLVGYPDSFGSADQLNDHHFHYSYFIKAAATLAQYDPDWAASEQFGGMIELLIRDCANPDRKDQRFPWMRNFDPYAGHSWASGHAGFASGNNQESSSESVHFATALILYGEATGQKEIRDLGIYWYSTEVEAIRQYWFDEEQNVFPPAFGHTCVGMVWGDGAAYGTWWTANPEEIHGINFLPLHGGSLYLGRDPDYLQANMRNMTQSNRAFHDAGFEGDPDRIDRWFDILVETEALAQPDKALSRYKAEGSHFEPEFGETRTHTMQWLTALQALGQVDLTVRANHPTAVMFREEGKRNYVVFNAGKDDVDVTYSDGSRWTIPPGLHCMTQE